MSMGTPRLSCVSSRPFSYAKLDQRPMIAPDFSEQHAVVVERRIHQRDAFDVAVPEAHRARQRQQDRLDLRDLGACASCSSLSPPRPTTVT